MNETYFRLVRDSEAEWFVIPEDKSEVWYNWDWRKRPNGPDWADQVGGGANKVVFEKYYIEGRPS